MRALDWLTLKVGEVTQFLFVVAAAFAAYHVLKAAWDSRGNVIRIVVAGLVGALVLALMGRVTWLRDLLVGELR